MYKVENEQGEWVKVAKPENGQRYRHYVGGGFVESFWSDPTDVANTKISKLAFKQRMTQQERVAVREAAKTDAQVYDFQDLLDSATYVDLSRQDTIDGVSQLEQAGLLGAGRADEILNTPVSEEEIYRG